MRELQKTEIDANTKKISIVENGIEIVVVCPPTMWAFKNNTIIELDQALTKLNKPVLTNDEKNLLQSWMN